METVGAAKQKHETAREHTHSRSYSRASVTHQRTEGYNNVSGTAQLAKPGRKGFMSVRSSDRVDAPAEARSCAAFFSVLLFVLIPGVVQ